MTDPIADMLTRIRNAYMADLKKTEVPFSKLKFALAEKILELGYVRNISVSGEGKSKLITLELKYKGKTSVISGIKRISKPGRRNYVASKNIKPILSGYGTSILTTSKGVLSDKEARQAQVGGEILCQIW